MPHSPRLTWSGAWGRCTWALGETREAWACRRGGRYTIRREVGGFVVAFRPPHSLDEPWVAVGCETSAAAAVALAEAHDAAVADRCKRRSNNPSLKRPGIPVAPE